MHLRSIVLPAAAFAAIVGCSRAGLRAGDGAVGGNADGAGDIAGSGGITPSTGGARSSGGAGGGIGSDAGAAGGGGGTPGCLDRSPLGLGVGGGACESVRCLVADPPALGYATCTWLVTAGRPSVFEAVRACFDADLAFCSHESDAVATCTSSIFARTCPGSGATVAGVHVDCATVAVDCPAVSETECQRLTNVLNDEYYQAAFRCYFQPMSRPTDCAAALRACVGVPTRATGGAGGAGGTTDTGGAPGTGGRPGTGGTTAGPDGGTQRACPDVAGTWTVAVDCTGPGAFFTGAVAAVMTQNGCQITFTQTDDATGAQWTTTGTLDSNGRGSLRGHFAFTDSSMCDVEVTADGWQGRCGSATQACELHAVLPRGGP